MTEPIWKPSSERIEKSNITQFKRNIESKYNLNFSDYSELHDWSINHNEDFWKEIWNSCNLIYSKEFSSITGEYKDTKFKIPRPEWFPSAELNFAENLLKNRSNDIAISYWLEGEENKTITYDQLYSKVARLSYSLKLMGVRKGDRVAGFVSNTPEAVIGMLAATSLGAIWSSCSPDFGYKGVIDRFEQIEPKVLIAVNGYSYNGKDYSTIEQISKVANDIESLEKVVIIKAIETDAISNPKFVTWSKFTQNECDEIKFVQVSFDHPVYIMFSSGTTGTPKCIVHSTGGTLLQHWKELYLHCDLNKNKSIMYFTTCGWMMWNWLVSSLFIGSKVVLFDGSPAHPNLNRFWDIVDLENLNILGTSPKYLSALQKSNIYPLTTHKLESLETILSTGSPLTKENYKYVYEHIKKDVLLSSITGGTDILGCFALGNPNLPVYLEELQCKGLGMDIHSWNENKESVINMEGELVCLNPFPSMPIYFWNDEENERYHKAYFNYFEGIWRHGDFILVTERKGVTVLGRSDSTLNPGGIRIGTAEIYRIVESFIEVKDSVVVGQHWDDDIRVILFLVLTDGYELDEELTKRIKSLIREEATPRHVPKLIKVITEVPVTKSGKKVEIAIKKILEKEEIKNKTALANPEILEQFYQMTELME